MRVADLAVQARIDSEGPTLQVVLPRVDRYVVPWVHCTCRKQQTSLGLCPYRKGSRARRRFRDSGSYYFRIRHFPSSHGCTVVVLFSWSTPKSPPERKTSAAAVCASLASQKRKTCVGTEHPYHHGRSKNPTKFPWVGCGGTSCFHRDTL